VDDFVKRRTILNENIKTANSLIWGQCSDIMRQKVESSAEFETISHTGNATDLLKVIKNLAYIYEIQKYVPLAVYESKRLFYLCQQLRNQSIQSYFDHFQNQVAVISHIGGPIGNDPILLTKVGKRAETATELENDQKAKDMFLAVADRSWFGKLLEDLENDFLQGHDGYPKTLSDEYSLLTNWKEETRSDPKIPVVFTTTSQQNNRRNITCYRRGRIGHYSNNCPTRSGQTATDSMINETTTQSESTLLTAGTA
jgi:hypothetical protein